jgi:hypothetical protein
MASVIGITGLVTVRALGLRSLSLGAEPLPLPSEGFDYGWWNGALARWVQEGRVDYDAVLSEEGGLRSFVATMGIAGPRSTPERFRTEPERLAYYLNAYNALVLFAVIDNWPIESVHDVHGWLDPRKGFGFFYGLQMPLDGEVTNLYDLENEVIRGFKDARIHAAINCASKSCPALAPYAFEPAILDAQLDEVTRAFCSTAPHVGIDESTKQIQLSAIFDWYRVDFEEHARRLGRPATALDFIETFATPEMAAALSRARSADFEVVFQPYDWTLNR